MGSTKAFVLLVAFSFFCSGLCYLEQDGWINIELQHALDKTNPDKFSYRGNITIPSLYGIVNTYQNVLSDSDQENFKVLAQNNDFYRLKANVVYPDGRKVVFLTATKACALLQSQLTDVLWISIDGTGFVISITQTVVSSGTAECNKAPLSIHSIEDFNTDVVVKHMELAPIPDTASFIQKVEREREAREKGEVRDNRGFFAKYWMYIVPVVLLVFISGATNQEGAK